MEDKITNIEDYRPAYIFEAMCIHCGHRYVSVCPVGTKLKTLSCPACHFSGQIINTGEIIEDEEE